MIILDPGSATNCANDYRLVHKIIDSIAHVDTWKHDVVIKWQLFKNVMYQGKKLPELEHDVFLYAKDYAARYGYDTTASVFDEESLDFLLSTDPCFVKIACREAMYPLMSSIPDNVPIIVSVDNVEKHNEFIDKYNVEAVLCCVPDYPAHPLVYENLFSGLLHYGISDHTDGSHKPLWYLYEKYKPVYYECHFALPESTGLDAEDFARRPWQLKEIL